MVEAAQKKYLSKEPVIPEQVKLPSIRHLLFKNWSGNHLDIDIDPNSPYKYKFTNGVVSLVKHLLE